MRMQDAHSELINALWERSEDIRVPEDAVERVGALHLGGRVAESWRQEEELHMKNRVCLMEDLHKKNRRCLIKCLEIVCKGCGTEEAELRACRYWERSLGYEMPMARSLLRSLYHSLGKNGMHDSEESRTWSVLLSDLLRNLYRLGPGL